MITTSRDGLDYAAPIDQKQGRFAGFTLGAAGE
jgi:hypothetical protein